ncbi:MAG: vWA domain-containing protein [Phycisphaerales bacterium]
MTLLAPGAAIIAGAIAAPLLVLLYFLKLRRRPLRVSSTILWERAVHDLQVNAPFRWLRVTTLLILQLLALACLVIAIGRPAINLDEAAGQRVVVLIDRSAGMSARDQSGGITRLEVAKKRARELIDSVLGASGSRVMLVQFAADAQAITPMTADRAVIDEAIDGVTASDQPADIGAALKLLNTAAQKEASESAERSVVSAFLISSGGFPPTDNNQLPVLAGAELRLVRIGPEPAQATANLGIAALSARRDFEDPTTVRVFLRVVNSAGVAARAPITLSIDGQQVGSVVLEMPATSGAFTATKDRPAEAGGSEARGSERGPTVGEATTTVGITNAAGGVLTAMIDAPDALTSDNFASLVMTAASKPRIVLVAPGANGNEADPFLLNALNVLDKASLRVMGADQFAAMESVGGGSGTGGNTSAAAPDYDIVFFDRVRPGKTPRAASVSFGAVAPIEGLAVERVTLAPGTPARRFVSWKRNHPVLRFVPLDTVILNPPMRLQLPNIDGGGEAGNGQERPGAGGPDRTTRSTLLADGVDGPLIGLIDHAGVRHVVVGFELERSNWGPQYPFPLFISNCVEFLTLRAEAQAGRSFLTVASVTVQPVVGVKEITVTPPPQSISAASGIDIAAKPYGVGVPDEGGLAERRTVSLGVLERAGIYRLSGAVEPAVAVNLTDAWTSLLRTSDTLEVIGQAGAKVEAIGSPREVWRWFVLAAACLLSLEWLIYTLQMRG